MCLRTLKTIQISLGNNPSDPPGLKGCREAMFSTAANMFPRENYTNNLEDLSPSDPESASPNLTPVIHMILNLMILRNLIT